VPLVVVLVSLPTFLEPPDGASEDPASAIVHRARLHGLEPGIRRVEGNPIREWASASKASDLAVVARRATTRDSFTRPDLALRLARRCGSSVLVVTVPG
jgi:nucleotide-binding universal stress UspA family protein